MNTQKDWLTFAAEYDGMDTPPPAPNDSTNEMFCAACKSKFCGAACPKCGAKGTRQEVNFSMDLGMTADQHLRQAGIHASIGHYHQLKSPEHSKNHFRAANMHRKAAVAMMDKDPQAAMHSSAANRMTAEVGDS